MHCLTTEGLFRALGIEGRKHGGEFKLGGEAVTAHPRYDPDTGRVALLACNQLPGTIAYLASSKPL
jgi:carotenoid cleavage dioxygenase-like enzyme